MTKEEKIAEAYGELYRKHQNRIDKNNGSIDAYYVNEDDRDLIDFRTYKLGKGYYYIIPKSLWGIENNNGWILISEQLPKLGDKIIFCINTTFNHFEEFTFVTSEFLGTYEYFGVTHWKYNDSKPPIF